MIRSCRGKKTTMCPPSTTNENNIVQMWKSVPLFTITESQYPETINDDRRNSSSYDFYPFSLIRIGRSTNGINRDALDIITGIEEEEDGLKHTEEDEKTIGTSSITDDESDDEDGQDNYEYTPPSAQQELHHII